MREYETTFIVQPEISDEGVGELFARLDGVLEKNDSICLLYDDQGRKRLAYEIDTFQKGRYVSLLFLDEGQAVAELERTLRLEDSVLRFLTIQVTEEVADIEARKAEAAELKRIREQKAAERAAREAEEAAKAAEEEAERARVAAEQAAAAEKAQAEAAASPEAGAETGDAAEGESAAEAAAGPSAPEADPAPSAPPAESAESADEEKSQ